MHPIANGGWMHFFEDAPKERLPLPKKPEPPPGSEPEPRGRKPGKRPALPTWLKSHGKNPPELKIVEIKPPSPERIEEIKREVGLK